MSAFGTKRTWRVHRTCPLLGVKRTWLPQTPRTTAPRKRQGQGKFAVAGSQAFGGGEKVRRYGCGKSWTCRSRRGDRRAPMACAADEVAGEAGRLTPEIGGDQECSGLQ